MVALPLLMALAVGQTDPYVRSRADTGLVNDKRAHCLWWGNPAVTFRQNVDGNPDIVGDSEFAAAAKALASWNEAGGACTSLTVTEGPRTSERDIGWVEGAENQNIVVYRMQYCGSFVSAQDGCWGEQTCPNVYDCFDQAKATIAITTTTYDRKTGEIYDADIEGNGAYFVFTTVDSPKCPDMGPFTQACIATDVQNTMTHEVGHALGLDHTLASGSTMNPSAPGGEITKRVLDPGTRSFVCDVYPKAAPSRDCVILVAKPELGSNANSCGVPTPLGSLGLLAFGFAAATFGGRRRGSG